MFACGSGDGELKFEQINPGIKTYSITDFQSAGFKVVKEYDVEGLTGQVRITSTAKIGQAETSAPSTRFDPLSKRDHAHRQGIFHGLFFS